MTRRQWFQRVVAVGCPAVLASGCGDSRKQNAAGQTMTVAGGQLVMVPHPIAKVVGAVLIAGGTALVIDAVLEDGTPVQHTVNVTVEQRERIEKGEQVEAKGSNGKGAKVTPTKK